MKKLAQVIVSLLRAALVTFAVLGLPLLEIFFLSCKFGPGCPKDTCELVSYLFMGESGGIALIPLFVIGMTTFFTTLTKE